MTANKVFSSINRLAPVFIFAIAILIRLIVIKFYPAHVDESNLIEEMLRINWHALPVHFIGSGGGENVLLAFLGWPLVFKFGLQPLMAIRLVTLVSNTFLLYWIYLVAFRFFDRRTALVALIFAAIWPWSIIAGSIAFNAFLAVTLITWGAYLLIVSIEKNRHCLSFFAALLFAAGCYAYILSFIWILTILIVWLLRYKRRCLAIHYGISILLLALLIMPIVLFYISLQFPWITLNHFLWFKFPTLKINRITYESVIHASSLGSGLLWYLLNHLMHFYFVLLAWTPSKTMPFMWMYLAYIWDALFIYVAVYNLIKKWRSHSWLILSLLLFPIGSSLTMNDIGYLETRDIVGLPILILLSAYGCIYLTRWIRSKASHDFTP